MGIQLPDALTWLFKLTGSEWPNVDEDKVAAFGARLAEVHPQILDVADSMTESVRLANLSSSGPAMGSFTDSMRDVVDNGMPAMADGARVMAGEIHDAALQAEYSKGTAVINMAILAPTILEAIAAAPETFGATLSVAEAGVAAARATVPKLLTQMVEKVATNTAMMEAGDLAVQGYQVLVKRDRSGLDGNLSLSTVESAAIGGAVDGVLSGALMKAAPGFFKAAEAGVTDADKLLWAPPRWANMGLQAANNTATSLLMSAVDGQPIDTMGLLQGAGLGLFLGGIHHEPGVAVKPFDELHFNEDFLNGDSWVRPNSAYDESKAGDSEFALAVRRQPGSEDGTKTVYYGDPTVDTADAPPMSQRLGPVIDKVVDDHHEGASPPRIVVLEGTPPGELAGIKALAQDKGVEIVIPHGQVEVGPRGALGVSGDGAGGFHLVRPDGSVDALGPVYDPRQMIGAGPAHGVQALQAPPIHQPSDNRPIRPLPVTPRDLDRWRADARESQRRLDDIDPLLRNFPHFRDLVLQAGNAAERTERHVLLKQLHTEIGAITPTTLRRAVQGSRFHHGLVRALAEFGHDPALAPTDHPAFADQVEVDAFRLTYIDVRHDGSGMWIRDPEAPHDMQTENASTTMLEDPGHFTVILHGSQRRVFVGDTPLDAYDMASLLRHTPEWADDPRPIRMIACNTGEDDDGFAQQLADLLGVQVKAPNTVVWGAVGGKPYASALVRKPDGTIRPVRQVDGAYRVFSPTQIADQSRIRPPIRLDATYDYHGEKPALTVLARALAGSFGDEVASGDPAMRKIISDWRQLMHQTRGDSEQAFDVSEKAREALGRVLTDDTIAWLGKFAKPGTEVHQALDILTDSRHAKARGVPDPQPPSLPKTPYGLEDRFAPSHVVPRGDGDEIDRRTLPPETIDQLPASRRIARGAMGEVFVSEHDGRQYAVKQPTVAGVADLRRETATLITINERFPNGNFAKYRGHSFGDTPEQHRLVLDLADSWLEALVGPGGDLARLPPAERSLIARDVISAVRDLHSLGLSHRDINPKNILLSGQGDQRRAVLADFGSAGPVREDVEAALERTVIDDYGYPSLQEFRASDLAWMEDELRAGLNVDYAEIDRRAAIETVNRIFNDPALHVPEHLSLDQVEHHLRRLLPDDYPAPTSVRRRNFLSRLFSRDGGGGDRRPFAEDDPLFTTPQGLREFADHAVKTFDGKPDHILIRDPDHPRVDELEATSHSLPEEPGYFTVDAHGGPDGIHIGGRRLSVDQLARIIENDPQWQRERPPIRLASCRTGHDPDGFARQLARRLGVEVKAPTDTLWISHRGDSFVTGRRYADDGTVRPVKAITGGWQVFSPHDDVEPHIDTEDLHAGDGLDEAALEALRGFDEPELARLEHLVATMMPEEIQRIGRQALLAGVDHPDAELLSRVPPGLSLDKAVRASRAAHAMLDSVDRGSKEDQAYADKVVDILKAKGWEQYGSGQGKTFLLSKGTDFVGTGKLSGKIGGGQVHAPRGFQARRDEQAVRWVATVALEKLKSEGLEPQEVQVALSDDGRLYISANVHKAGRRLDELLNEGQAPGAKDPVEIRNALEGLLPGDLVELNTVRHEILDLRRRLDAAKTSGERALIENEIRRRVGQLGGKNLGDLLVRMRAVRHAAKLAETLGAPDSDRARDQNRFLEALDKGVTVVIHTDDGTHAEIQIAGYLQDQHQDISTLTVAGTKRPCAFCAARLTYMGVLKQDGQFAVGPAWTSGAGVRDLSSTLTPQEFADLVHKTASGHGGTSYTHGLLPKVAPNKDVGSDSESEGPDDLDFHGGESDVDSMSGDDSDGASSGEGYGMDFDDERVAPDDVLMNEALDEFGNLRSDIFGSDYESDDEGVFAPSPPEHEYATWDGGQAGRYDVSQVGSGLVTGWHDAQGNEYRSVYDTTTHNIRGWTATGDWVDVTSDRDTHTQWRIGVDAQTGAGLEFWCDPQTGCVYTTPDAVMSTVVDLALESSGDDDFDAYVNALLENEMAGWGPGGVFL